MRAGNDRRFHARGRLFMSRNAAGYRIDGLTEVIRP